MLINPVFIFTFSWISVILLYLLGLTKNLVNPSLLGILVIFSNILSMIVVYVLIFWGRSFRENNNIELYRTKILNFLKTIAFLWVLGTIFEIYYCGGFPLLWKLKGINRLYTEFGIPSFHGILNAFYLQIITITSFFYFRYKRRIYFIFLFLLLIWPVLMLGRGILLSAFLQIICIFFYLNRLTVKRTFSVIFLCVAIVFVFGIVGDMRQTVNPFLYLVKDDFVDFVGSLPSGFLWFYVYLTAGLSNFFFNIDSLATNFQFGYSFSNMLPSFVKSLINADVRNDALNFVDVNLNTSTVYAGFISDFGALGGILFVTIIQLFCCIAYLLLMKGKPWGIFAYSVCLQILAFTIFYDMFFLLPTLFQFVLCFVLYLYSVMRVKLM